MQGARGGTLHQTIAGLTVGYPAACDAGNDRRRNEVGRLAHGRHALPVMHPRPDHYVGPCGLKTRLKAGDLLRVVLAVGVERYSRDKPVFAGPREPGLKRPALASIHLMNDDTSARPGGHARRVVRRPVVHHKHRAAVGCGRNDDSRYPRFFIIRGNNRADPVQDQSPRRLNRPPSIRRNLIQTDVLHHQLRLSAAGKLVETRLIGYPEGASVPGQAVRQFAPAKRYGPEADAVPAREK